MAKLTIRRLSAREIVEEAMADATIPQTQEEAERTVGTPHHKRPFCGDSSCDCHNDNEAYHLYVMQPLNQGLLTIDEANRIFYGRQ